VDKSGANLAALEAINADRETPIRIRQNKYLNNIVKQDHRAIRRIIRPMMGFKDFRCARLILSGIEVMHMIRKGQMKTTAMTSQIQTIWSVRVRGKSWLPVVQPIERWDACPGDIRAKRACRMGLVTPLTSG
jgi:hypothetical protein